MAGRQRLHLRRAVQIECGRGRDIGRGYILAFDCCAGRHDCRGTGVHIRRVVVVVVVGLIAASCGRGIELRGAHIVWRLIALM